PVDGEFLKQVRIAQFQPTVARAVLDVEKIDTYSVFSLPNPFRIVIDIHGNPPLSVQRSIRARSPGRLTASQPVTPTVSVTTAVSPRLVPKLPHTTSGQGETVDSSLEETTGEEIEATAPPASESTASLTSPNVSAANPSHQSVPKVAGTSAEINSDSSVLRHKTQGTSTKGATDDSEFTYRPSTSRESEVARSERAGPPYLGGSNSAVAAAPGTLTRALGLKIGRIVIDPGHGGHDTGTIGPHG